MKYSFNIIAIILCISYSLSLHGQFQDAYLNLGQMSLMPSKANRLKAAVGFMIPSQDFSLYGAYNVKNNISITGLMVKGDHRSSQYIGGVSYFIPLSADKTTQLDFSIHGGFTNTYSPYFTENSFFFPSPSTISTPTQVDLRGRMAGGKIVLSKEFRDTRFRFISTYSKFGFNRIVNYDAYPTQFNEFLTSYDPSLSGLNLSVEVDFISNCKCMTFKFDMFNKLFGSESFETNPGMYLGINQNIFGVMSKKHRDLFF